MFRCGHCKSLAPEWKKAALAVKGIVNFGAVDADKHGSLGSQYGVQGFPTIKVFGADKSKPTDYQGARTAEGLVDAAISQVRKVSKSRLSGKNSSKQKTKQDKKKKKAKVGTVVTLTDSNFNENVMQSSDIWMVEFYAPWCGHCKSLAPEWKQAAKELKGSGVKLAELDATAYQAAASEYGIKGFPTIKYFLPGAKSAKDAKDYQGPRTSAGIVAFALDQLEKNGGSISPLVELTEQSVLNEHCEDNSICVVAFLPHILDSMKKGREEYIGKLDVVAKNFRGKAFRFGWMQAGDQEKWESALGLTFGFPCVVAINFDKQRFAIQRGSFSTPAIKKFLNGIVSGSEATDALPKLGDLKKVSPWDGKEGVLPQEDDLLKDEL